MKYIETHTQSSPNESGNHKLWKNILNFKLKSSGDSLGFSRPGKNREKGYPDDEHNLWLINYCISPYDSL